MPNPIDIESLDALGQLLAEREIAFGAVVIGGASLIAHGIVERTTVDIDVIARREGDGSIFAATSIPPEVEAAALAIANLRDLDPNWFNADASLIFGGRFPQGYETRLTSETFGGLTVWWVAPGDLVAFKLYANLRTIDKQPNRHRQDLERLEPSQQQVTAAIAWIESIVPARSRKLETLASIIEELGFEY